MANRCELHVSKSFSELENQCKLPKLDKHKKAKILYPTAKKLLMEAERYSMLGDEEMSYIFYMKYFTVLGHLKKCHDYIIEKNNINQNLGTNETQIHHMDKLAGLQTSLKNRFKQLEELASESEELNNSQRTCNLAKVEECKAPEVTINCEELHNLIYNGCRKTLVIDCRPQSDYANSHLKNIDCLSIPEESLQVGLSAGALEQILKNDEDKELWRSRRRRDRVILMDWSTAGPQPVRGSALNILQDIMRNWDPDVEYKSLVFLEEGYEFYILMYPMDTTNPNVSPPVSQNPRDDNIEDVEYPNLNDITMKESVNYEVAKRPVVDRGSKIAAISCYNKKKDYLKEQELIADQVLDSQRQRLDEELQLVKIITSPEANNVTECETPMEEDDEDKENQINERVFKIMQLDTTIEDNLMRKKELENESMDIAEVEDDEENRKLALSIELKNEESKRIESKRKELEEQEQQLKIAKQQKKYLAVRDTNKQLPPQPVIPPRPTPTFDRSVKPAHADPDSKRDFAPVFGQVGRGLTGLKNLGNTCYMNSVMQCLSNTSALVEYFMTGLFRKHINYANKTHGQIVKEVAALIKELWSGQCRSIASKDLRFIVGQYQQMFRGIEQQDSHEFLTILIDWLHSDLQTMCTLDKSIPRNASEKAWQEYTQNKESLIFRLFYGQIKSTVKCKECLTESATYESFSNLSLELPTNNTRSDLSNCFDMYFSGETVFGWYCPNCKQKRDAIKKLDISKLPPVLVIHLKRFYADYECSTLRYKKKCNYIDFPINNLDIQEYVVRTMKQDPRLNSNYHLYAVSNHYGSMESGHYTAFCKNNLSRDWFKYDDQTVSRLDRRDVVSSGAYILFYTNLPDQPLSVFKKL